MLIKSFKINSKLKFILPISFTLLLIFTISFSFWQLSSANNDENGETEESYIKWFEFNVTYNVLEKTSSLDINSRVNNEEIKYNWIELISYLACKYGNDFSKFKQKDLDELTGKLQSGQTMEELTQNMKYYPYYFEGYDSVLHEFIGSYQIEKKKEENTTKNSTNNVDTTESNVNNESESNMAEENNEEITKAIEFEETYGIKAFHPLAKNYGYSHYDDFGASRSYGYQRLHFGHDLMGSIGTPVIAIESGIVEAVGWNQYGGWRIGIRSFDQKRYYYYAHLRKDHPYAEGLEEGDIVQAGDVIGYLGMTGYSVKENVNNINVPHLHFGIQLIFNEVQKEGPNQIWVNLYDLTDFLKKHRSEVYKSNEETKDYSRKYQIMDPIVSE